MYVYDSQLRGSRDQRGEQPITLWPRRYHHYSSAAQVLGRLWGQNLGQIPAMLSAPRPAPTTASVVDIRTFTRKPGDPQSLEDGVGTVKAAPFRLMGDPLDIIIGSTAAAEGGYDTVNMYDRGILSWGIMQWSVHAGSLQKALAFIKQRLAQKRQVSLQPQLFPDLDVHQTRGEYQLTYRGKPVIGQTQLRQLFRGSPERGRYHAATIFGWAELFARAGRHPVIQQIQQEYAREKVNEVLRINLGQAFSRFKQSQCKKTKKDPIWEWICNQLTESPEFYRSYYGRVSNYVGADLKAATLFFGMWTQNPAVTYMHMKKAIDTLAARYRTHEVTHWPAGWEIALGTEFERVLRASGFAYWGDAKAKAAKPKPRTSRTQKILNEFYRLTAKMR